jgi:uncharacterized protein (TIGR02646 family)
VIPVTPQPEPIDFDAKVRTPGLKWLRDHGIDPSLPPPDPKKLPTYWRNVQIDLWRAYAGVCAYLTIYFEWPSGASSTDHFIAKSRLANQAYEWSNYRLSCLGMNRNKGNFEDILDPFDIQPNTFTLNLASGRIAANLALPPVERTLAEATIRRLKLDAPETNRMRAEHYTLYSRGEVSAAYLQRLSMNEHDIGLISILRKKSS